MSGLDGGALMTGVADHALRSGLFERVNGHEPKNAPGNGLTAAVWVDTIDPVALASGLAATAARVAVMLRIYSSMLQEPQDAIDPNVVSAASALMASFSGDFDLGGQVRNVDLLGQHGVGLRAQAAYLEQDRKHYRVMTVTVPLIINDVWNQVA
jgi:hypothetical protein